MWGVYLFHMKNEKSPNDELDVKEVKLRDWVSVYKRYNFHLNNEVVGYMIGLKKDGVFNLDVIQTDIRYRGKHMGEKFIIKYLQKFGGSICSEPSGGRSYTADKMWERLYRRDDVIIMKEEIFHSYYKIIINHYTISLKFI